MKNRVTAPTWAEINLDNINFNLNNIRKLLKEDTKICTVLKANAYGHGSVEIAKFLENKNVDYFAVARLEEAIELRENNILCGVRFYGWDEFFYEGDVSKLLDQEIDKEDDGVYSWNIKDESLFSEVTFSWWINMYYEVTFQL